MKISSTAILLRFSLAILLIIGSISSIYADILFITAINNSPDWCCMQAVKYPEEFFSIIPFLLIGLSLFYQGWWSLSVSIISVFAAIFFTSQEFYINADKYGTDEQLFYWFIKMLISIICNFICFMIFAIKATKKHDIEMAMIKPSPLNDL